MDKNVFWDKKDNIDEIKKILRDDKNKKFVEYASILLARSNEPKKVFGEYINVLLFCKNWKYIKKRMRDNEWNNKRIDFWDEIYRIARTDLDKVRGGVVKYRRKTPINRDVHEIGQTLQRERRNQGWTQKEFSKKIGLSQQTISLIERGNLNFSFKTFIKVAKALNITIVLQPKRKNEISMGDTFTCE